MFLPAHAFAALYINEFSSNSDPDWVEIYNSDSSSVDLSNYLLRDSTDANKQDLTGSIPGNGFVTFDWSNRLDNNGDTIRLVVLNEGGVENNVDQITYGSGGTVAAPASGQTAGRSPDGSSNIVLLSSSSKGSSNNSATPVPTATSAPTNTPTPTPTPTPTKTPTPTPSPTSGPTATPTKAPMSTAAPVLNLSPTDYPTPTDDPDSNLKLASNVGRDDVFGNDETPTPAKGMVLGLSTTNSSVIFIALGLILMIFCGILAYFQFGDKILPWKKNKNL